MAEQFTGRVDFLSSAGKVIFTIDPDAGFVQVIHRAGTGQNLLNLTNTASLNLGGSGEDYRARLDGTLGWLVLGGHDRDGRLSIRDGDRNEIIVMDGASAAVYVGAEDNEGDVIVRDDRGRNVFHADGRRARVTVGADGNAGEVVVHNRKGAETIRLDGDSGDVLLTNADCAEDFDLVPSTEAGPGTVMMLGPDGALGPSATPYDRAVAGVVRGTSTKLAVDAVSRPGAVPVHVEATLREGELEAGTALSALKARGRREPFLG